MRQLMVNQNGSLMDTFLILQSSVESSTFKIEYSLTYIYKKILKLEDT